MTESLTIFNKNFTSFSLNKNITSDFLKLCFAFIISRQIMLTAQPPGTPLVPTQSLWLRESILTTVGIFMWYTFLLSWVSNSITSLNLNQNMENAFLSATYKIVIIMAFVFIANGSLMSKGGKVTKNTDIVKHLGVIFALIFGYHAFIEETVFSVVNYQTTNSKTQEIVSILVLYTGLFYGYNYFANNNTTTLINSDHSTLSIPFGIGLALYTLLFE
jgi:hypothetical protein